MEHFCQTNATGNMTCITRLVFSTFNIISFRNKHQSKRLEKYWKQTLIKTSAKIFETNTNQNNWQSLCYPLTSIALFILSNIHFQEWIKINTQTTMNPKMSPHHVTFHAKKKKNTFFRLNFNYNVALICKKFWKISQ